MKKWTVMLIPHDRSSTRTLTLSTLHFGLAVGMLVILTFATSFLFQRQRVMAAKNERLHEINRTLEFKTASEPMVQVVEQGESDQLNDVEARLRAEYEATLRAITAELTALYDMEAKARDITGIAPRETQPDTFEPEENTDGQGGASTGFGSFAYSGIDEQYRPAHVIYGMARPSADLIMQEIQLRQRSLNDLVVDMEREIDRIARVPSSWPLIAGRGKITSQFGYRKDPFHRRVRHHDGTDIAAPTGTPVRATAKGRVVYSAFDGAYGNLVKIDHGNGIQTWYAHLSKRTVSEGDVVAKNDRIGHVGSTGRSTGPHLHYEVHVNGRPVNAAKYLTE